MLKKMTLTVGARDSYSYEADELATQAATEQGFVRSVVKIPATLWETDDTEVITNELTSTTFGDGRCKHSVPVASIEVLRPGTPPMFEEYVVNPLVASAKNEGGYCSTGICVLCLIDWVKDNRPDLLK